MVVCDARQEDCPIVLANAAFLDLTGYSANEIVGRNCRFLQGAETSASSVADIRQAVTAGRGLTIELLNYRKNGTEFWNQLHISPVHEDTGELAYFFASQVDVTETRKVQTLEASQHRLMMEIDHRAKNVLAIVNSVVRLSQSQDAAAYAAAVQQRVIALSQAHELLADRGWKEVDLFEIVQQQTLRFRGVKLQYTGPAVMVPADIVQPITLVFHELAMNAGLHGSMTASGGRLSVTWKNFERGSGVQVSWHETQGPCPQHKGLAGFGSVIIGAVVEKQLLGHVDRHWHDDGVTIEMNIPL